MPCVPLTRFTLRQIEAFMAVAESHSFTLAAARLGLTAQAMSQLIAELEAILDFRLFDRTTRKVALSSAGRDYQTNKPKVVVRVRDVPVDQLVDRVADGDVDLALGPDRHTGPSVAATPLFDSAWVQPESVRKVCLYTPATRALSPAAAGFSEFLATRIPRWSTDG